MLEIDAVVFRKNSYFKAIFGVCNLKHFSFLWHIQKEISIRIGRGNCTGCHPHQAYSNRG
jgi:hypothetical protein